MPLTGNAMSSAIQAFASLVGNLRDALAASDWEAVAKLDDDCRHLITGLGEVDAHDVGLREQLAELSRLYEELQRAGRAERERLVVELTRMNQSKQVNQAYRSLG